MTKGSRKLLRVTLTHFSFSTSNKEPIIRFYAESSFETTANSMALKVMKDIKEIM